MDITIDLVKLNDTEHYGNMKLLFTEKVNMAKTKGEPYTEKTREDIILRELCQIYGVGINFVVTRKFAKRILKKFSSCSHVDANGMQWCLEQEGRKIKSNDLLLLKKMVTDEEYNLLSKRDKSIIPVEGVVAIALSKSFYKSREWKSVRYQAFRVYKNFCQCCGRKASDEVWLNVDHIKPRSLAPELALDVSNLQILCMDCNSGKSNLDCINWRD